MDPPTNLHPLTAMLFTVPNLNLVENGGGIVMRTHPIATVRVLNTPAIGLGISDYSRLLVSRRMLNYSLTVTRKPTCYLTATPTL